MARTRKQDPDGEYGVASKAKAGQRQVKQEEKVPRVRKDGNPVKKRDPRGPLFPWLDSDYRQALLALAVVCGDHDFRIPWDDAARIINRDHFTLTGSALQQALLKLRDKQLAAGRTVPKLSMHWTKKKSAAAAESSASNAEGAPSGTPNTEAASHGNAVSNAPTSDHAAASATMSANANASVNAASSSSAEPLPKRKRMSRHSADRKRSKAVEGLTEGGHSDASDDDDEQGELNGDGATDSNEAGAAKFNVRVYPSEDGTGLWVVLPCPRPTSATAATAEEPKVKVESPRSQHTTCPQAASQTSNINAPVNNFPQLGFFPIPAQRTDWSLPSLNPVHNLAQVNLHPNANANFNNFEADNLSFNGQYAQSGMNGYQFNPWLSNGGYNSNANANPFQAQTAMGQRYTGFDNVGVNEWPVLTDLRAPVTGFANGHGSAYNASMYSADSQDPAALDTMSISHAAGMEGAYLRNFPPSLFACDGPIEGPEPAVWHQPAGRVHGSNHNTLSGNRHSSAHGTGNASGMSNALFTQLNNVSPVIEPNRFRNVPEAVAYAHSQSEFPDLSEPHRPISPLEPRPWYENPGDTGDEEIERMLARNGELDEELNGIQGLLEEGRPENMDYPSDSEHTVASLSRSTPPSSVNSSSTLSTSRYFGQHLGSPTGAEYSGSSVRSTLSSSSSNSTYSGSTLAGTELSGSTLVGSNDTAQAAVGSARRGLTLADFYVTLAPVDADEDDSDETNPDEENPDEDDSDKYTTSFTQGSSGFNEHAFGSPE